MSLLMEALRKAEEAKRKVDDKQDVDSSDAMSAAASPEETDLEESELAEQEQETHNLMAGFDSATSESAESEDKNTAEDTADQPIEFAIEPESDSESLGTDPDTESGSLSSESESGQAESPAWADLDLQPIQEDKAEHDSVELSSEDIAQEGAAGDSIASELGSPDEESQEEVTNQVEPEPESQDRTLIVDPIVQDTQEEAFQADSCPGSERDFIDDLDEQGYEERDAESAAWLKRAKRVSNPRDRSALLLVALLVLLVAAGGGFYWYLGSGETVVPPPNRGFLSDLSTPAEEVVPTAQPNLSDDQGALDIESTTSALVEDLSAPEISDIVEVTSSIPEQDLASTVEQTRETVVQNNVFEISAVRTLVTDQSQLEDAGELALSGEIEDARSEYESVLQRQPDNISALRGLASLDIKEGELAEARDGYMRLLELDPRDPFAQVGLIETTQALDPLAQEAELKILAATYPNVSSLNFSLGNLLASQGRWNEASGAYSSALASAESSGDIVSPDYAFNLAVSFEQLNQPVRALEHYEQAGTLANFSSADFDLVVLDSRIQLLRGSAR